MASSCHMACAKLGFGLSSVYSGDEWIHIAVIAWMHISFSASLGQT
jgi:hypothetical protein